MIQLTPHTRFILSSSGRASSITKHNQILQKLGLDVVYYSFAHQITAKAYADILRAPFTIGAAVTSQGLKTDIIPLLDHVDPDALQCRAVNTVINKGGTLYGYDTDSFGLKAALSTSITSSHSAIKTAVIYGNGGVSGVAYHVLRGLGVRATLRGRSAERVVSKIHDLAITDFTAPFDLFVNATPISYQPLVLDAQLRKLLEDATCIFDHCMPEQEGKVNYLKQYAESTGKQFISGHEMYLPQMKKQWDLFLADYGVSYPVG